MDKKFFILIGRSGSGKGTQAELLKKSLNEKAVENVIQLTTGGGFRDFVAKDTYISSLSRKLNETGELQPEFLAVWNWSNLFIENLKGEETIILDGALRRKYEVEGLHSAILFMGYKNPIVIYVDVSISWAKERLLGRGRDDDKDEKDIENRMNWFETNVLSTLDTYLNDPRYKVLHINGEQTIEEVHCEIMKKLG